MNSAASIEAQLQKKRKGILGLFKSLLVFCMKCAKDGILQFIFGAVCIALLDSLGASFPIFAATGLIYLLLIGWGTLLLRKSAFSFAMLPYYCPAFLFYMSWHDSFEQSDDWAFVELFLWIILARWAAHKVAPAARDSYKNILRKVLFFSALQGVYGALFQAEEPEFVAELEWGLTGIAMRPGKPYPKDIGIQLFYENREEADKLAQYLPEVLKALKTSPFFQTSEELVLIQKDKKRLASAYGDEPNIFDIAGGCYHPFKEYSYYFSNPDSLDSSFRYLETYYSHKNSYKSTAIHELTHQLVGRYYGKLIAGMIIPTWKNEGYAEYVTAMGCYTKNDELLHLIKDQGVTVEDLENPFEEKQDRKSYVSALIQARYALDVKKVSPFDFFSSSYDLASSAEIMQWLNSSE